MPSTGRKKGRRSSSAKEENLSMENRAYSTRRQASRLHRAHKISPDRRSPPCFGRLVEVACLRRFFGRQSVVVFQKADREYREILLKRTTRRIRPQAAQPRFHWPARMEATTGSPSPPSQSIRSVSPQLVPGRSRRCRICKSRSGRSFKPGEIRGRFASGMAKRGKRVRGKCRDGRKVWRNR
jgi:hypothetical protein